MVFIEPVRFSQRNLYFWLGRGVLTSEPMSVFFVFPVMPGVLHLVRHGMESRNQRPMSPQGPIAQKVTQRLNGFNAT